MKKRTRFEEDIFKTIITAISDALYIVKEGHLLFSNKKFGEIFGYQPACSLTGKNIFKNVYPDLATRELFADMHETLLASPAGIISWSQPSSRIDHQPLWIELTAKRIEIDGQAAIMGTIRDITHLRELVAKMSSSIQTLMTLLDAFEDPIYAVTEDYEIVYANKTVRELGEMAMAEHGLKGSWQQFPCYCFRGFSSPCADCHNEAFASSEPIRWEFFHNYFQQWFAVTEVAVKMPGIHKKTKLTAGRNISPWKKAEERIRKLSHGLLNAQEAERKRLSRELHDDLAQQLCSIKLIASSFAGKFAKPGSKEKERFQLLSDALDNSLRTVRELAAGLRPASFEERGLEKAFREHFDKITSTHGLPIEFNSAGLKGLKLDETTSINLFRIVQEALHNVIKHAEAKSIKVQFDAANPGINLLIEDDGKGFSTHDFIQSGGDGDGQHLGLAGIAERVDLLNGELRILSGPDRGTKLNISTRVVSVA